MTVHQDTTAEKACEMQSTCYDERVQKLAVDSAGGCDPQDQHDGVNAESTSASTTEIHAIDGPSTPIIDTVAQRITFYYYDGTANSVALAGTFNEWRPTIRLKLEWRQIWKAEIPMLPYGTYHYRFVVDGREWVHDPENLNREPNAFGGFNSVFTIAGTGSLSGES